ncbi:glycoside hydrolase family 13 protein [Lactococcus lactis]
MIVLHENTNEFLIKKNRNKILIQIRIEASKAKEVKLVYFIRGTSNQNFILLEKNYTDGMFDYYSGEVRQDGPVAYLKYYFIIKTPDNSEEYFGPHGLEKEKITFPFEIPYINEGDTIATSDWLKDAIFYQIFPERFKNGDKTNDPYQTVPWGTTPTRDNHMGGDLKGIIDKIEYMSELGINCIYVTPIFKAMFNHKYATEDYFEIDEQFGTKKEFKELVTSLHNKNIRIILDGVFNHTGINFFAFKDILTNQRDSIYKDWFYIKKFPVEVSEKCYECVGNYKWMPKLNTSNAEVQKYLINVIMYWIKDFEIDGWRLDVSDELDKNFLKQVRRIIKKLDKNIPVIGETWGYPGDMLCQSEVDSVMNYVFRDNILEYVAKEKINTKEFIKRQERMYGTITDAFTDGLYHLLDSHDTERFITSCQNDIKKYKAAVALQMFMKGAPAIYYGDEIGIKGLNDPDCRRSMKWEKSKDEKVLFYYFQSLIKIRKENEAVRFGNISFHYNKGILIIKRKNNNQTLELLYNPTNEPIDYDEVPDGELLLTSCDVMTQRQIFQEREVKIVLLNTNKEKK